MRAAGPCRGSARHGMLPYNPCRTSGLRILHGLELHRRLVTRNAQAEPGIGDQDQSGDHTIPLVPSDRSGIRSYSTRLSAARRCLMSFPSPAARAGWLRRYRVPLLVIGVVLLARAALGGMERFEV